MHQPAWCVRLAVTVGLIQGLPGGSAVKNLPGMQETWVQSLDQEDPLEKELATHSSILAWRIHGQRSLAGYIVHGSQRVRHDSATKHVGVRASP